MTSVFTSYGKLASAGDDIKIWELPSFCIVNQFTPQSSASFRSLHWSPDSHQLIAVPSNGEKIFLTLMKNAAVHSIEVSTGMTNSCAKFSTSSPRYIGIGTTSGRIFMWDLKTQKPKKSFMGSCEVTCIQFNQKDTYIASGSVNGAIILHSLTTGQSFTSLKTSKIQSIRDLKYNNFRLSLLGSASDDGTICLWDTNSHILLHQYAASHNAPATGLVFSPINDSLLISVGLDKKIKCYDTQMKSCVNCLCSEAPFTAVDFMDDGITLAVGSTRGKIYLYDLRSSTVPLKIFDAHSVSVQSLAFQKLNMESTRKDILQMKTFQSTTSNNLSEPIKMTKILSNNRSCINSNILNSTEVSESDNLAQISNGSCITLLSCSKDSLSEAFSPLKDANADDPLLRKQPNASGVECLPTSCIDDNSVSSGLPTVETEQIMLSSSVQSPRSIETLNDNIDNHIDNSQTSYSAKCIARTTNSSSNFLHHETTAALSSPTQTISNSSLIDVFSPIEPSPHEHKVSPFRSSTQLQLPATLQARHMEPLTVVQQYTPHELSKNSSSASFPFTVDNLIGESITSVSNELIYHGDKQEIPELIMEQETTETNHHTGNCNLIPGTETKGKNPSLEKISLPPFQVEFIRKIVQDAMEEFTDALRSDLLSLHVQMIRQFQSQMAEIRTLVQKLSLNEELAAEVERLEEENRHLRTTF